MSICSIFIKYIFIWNFNKINWDNLAINKKAIELLKDNLDKIDWDLLSMNKNAIEILKDNQNKINWNLLSLNIYIEIHLTLL